MDRQQYIWLNGEFFRDQNPIFTIGNRSFAYGDGFFESIHAYGTEPKYLHLHFSRILKGMALLGMEMPPYLNRDFIEREIIRLLNKNRVFGSARVRLTFFRNQGGLYTPTDNSVSISMQSTPLLQDFYPYNSKGLAVDFFTQVRKPINILSPLKSCNSLLYVLAARYKQEQKLDDCILINDQNRVAEAISSNIFVVINNTIYTPSIDEGCISGVMRQVIIDLAPKHGYVVQSNEPIEAEMLIEADEVFLTNAISGIQWVVGLKQKRYFGIASKKLSSALNKETFNHLV
jgi:branched-chain amino acid aminotransferase